MKNNLSNTETDGFYIYESTPGKNITYRCKCKFCGEELTGMRSAYLTRKSDAFPAGCKKCRWKREASSMIGKTYGCYKVLGLSAEYSTLTVVMLDVACSCGLKKAISKSEVEKGSAVCKCILSGEII